MDTLVSLVPDPVWLFFLLGVRFWPVFLLGAVAAAGAAVVLRGGRRFLAGLAAVLLGLGPIGAAVVEAGRRAEDARFQAEYDRTHTVLTAETTLDGLALPPGTEVTWEDASRARLAFARMPRPADVLGVEAASVGRQGEDGWMVHMTGPRVLDGWPCDGFGVSLGRDGRLRSCLLSRPVEWNGWTLPARTGVTPRPAERKLGLFFAHDATVTYPGIEQPLPQEVSAHDDGSLDGADFLYEPLVLRGVALERVVEWRYDPATHGMGRDRPPLAVAGTTLVPVESRRDPVRVVVRLPDGAVTRERGRERD